MKKIYLAIPYSGMEESSFTQATKAAAILMESGVNVFSPITHCHSIAVVGKLPGTWEFWEKIDRQFIDWCDEVWVLIPDEGIEKVENSTGVNAEIHYAKNIGKPVKFLERKIKVQEVYTFVKND
jgi:nucleoside 2-deoxyribosyltransferase|tara:strand:- start:2835 stop:3206 length:372 start_codon:yes stop_codon:yes gene_type:complete